MNPPSSFKSVLVRLDSSVWGLGFVVPKEVVQAWMKTETRRFVLTFNGGKKVHRAIMPGGEGSGYFHVSQNLMKERNIRKGDEVLITIAPDTSEYGMEMPEEMQETLNLYPEAKKHFLALTPGKQRNLIHMVQSLKRTDSRVKKAVQILEYLEHYQGNLDFRALHQWIKNSNQGS